MLRGGGNACSGRTGLPVFGSSFPYESERYGSEVAEIRMRDINSWILFQATGELYVVQLHENFCLFHP